MTSPRVLVFAAGLLAFQYCCAYELSPEVYKAMQAKAPERLTISVQKVTTSKAAAGTGDFITTVTAMAKVKSVVSSKSLLKRGQIVTIHYTNRHFSTPVAGPSQVPILKRGATCPAYLRKIRGKDAFSPAAGGFSFQTVK